MRRPRPLFPDGLSDESVAGLGELLYPLPSPVEAGRACSFAVTSRGRNLYKPPQAPWKTPPSEQHERFRPTRCRRRPVYRQQRAIRPSLAPREVRAAESGSVPDLRPSHGNP